MPRPKNIALIYTGGTIGGEINNDSKTISKDVQSKKFKQLVESHLRKRLKSRHIHCDYFVPFKKLSEENQPNDWLEIAKFTRHYIHTDYDGFVIPHGTDTLAYTAAALSLFLRNSPKPLILTGANLPLQDKQSDGWTNVYHSILAACLPRLKGVFVVFAGIRGGVSHIHLGSRIRKLRAEGNCYISVNIPPIGYVRRKFFLHDQIDITSPKVLNFYHGTWKGEMPRIPKSFDHRVGFIKLVPGLQPQPLRNQIEEGIKALLIEGYGSGTGPTADSHYSLIPTLKFAADNGVPVFLTSQCVSAVKPEAYGSSVHLQKAGVIGLKDMSTEMAFVKLIWATSQTTDKSKIQKLMLKNFAGEVGFH